MENIKLNYKFITNIKYFPATDKFKIVDPFRLERLIPKKVNHVFASLYVQMPSSMKYLPKPGVIPKGTVPFLRVMYKILRENELYTGELKKRWIWNLRIPAKTPIILGIKSNKEGHPVVEARFPKVKK
jgi:hypothetical protein